MSTQCIRTVTVPKLLVNSRSRPGCYACREMLYLCQSCTRQMIELLDFQDTRALQFLRQFKPDPLSESFTGDVILVGSDSSSIPAHRFILAGKSIVFEKMFAAYSEMEESKTGVVKITDISSPLLRSVVQFCYSAQISFSGDVPAEEVLKVADKYEIASLVDVCEEHLIEGFTKENVLEKLRVAYRCKLVALERAGITFVRENTAEFLKFILLESNSDSKDESVADDESQN